MGKFFFALMLAILIVPQFCYAEGPDTGGADEEYVLLLRFALETTPDSLSAEAQDKANEAEQKKKIIITIIPDTNSLP
ncbi:MAG TPA: hypothetical protein VJW95_03450 [Dissulfurispiraceae bacterium]|nr:hypothetical protein [Dissulfurispiraceae bacterium]